MSDDYSTLLRFYLEIVLSNHVTQITQPAKRTYFRTLNHVGYYIIKCFIAFEGNAL